MKAKHYISAISLLFGVSFLQAQNTFQNAEVSQDHDLQGTARYVAMGGAFTALGADISAMATTPQPRPSCARVRWPSRRVPSGAPTRR